MYILGLSALYHDSAAALIQNGNIVAAAQEERFTRKKHDEGFPHNAIKYCLKEAGIDINQIDFIVFYDKPLLKFERILETFLNHAPKGFPLFLKAMPVWLKEKLFQKSLLINELKLIGADQNISNKILFTEHHLSHAASAFYPSPFEKAIVLTMDGVGEWATTSIAIGSANQLDIVKEMHYPHSLGLLYSAFTYFTGFKVNSGEYKVMGLAPYGRPIYKQKILDHLIDLKEDGSFKVNLEYFEYPVGLKMINKKFVDLFGIPVRKDEDRLDQTHMDLAASIQAVTEEVVLRITRHVAKTYNIPNLCLAGGVALNCVANGKILRDNKFEKIWIQPAAGDAGGALGAALYAYYCFLNKSRNVSQNDSVKGSFLGPKFSNEEVINRLQKVHAKFESLDEDKLINNLVEDLIAGKAVGLSRGRMEFGPRALGGRSIIADARNPEMQKTLNLRIKYRESFRPFAPIVLREHVSEWFELDTDSPYMLLVSKVKDSKIRQMSKDEESLFGIEKLNVMRSDIPAVTHVDYSARIQTIDANRNPFLHKLMTAFYKKTGCPVLVNTSFNVRGEPIVCTPEDSFRCFMGTEIETLVVENCYLRKELQDSRLKENYLHTIEKD